MGLRIGVLLVAALLGFEREPTLERLGLRGGDAGRRAETGHEVRGPVLIVHDVTLCVDWHMFRVNSAVLPVNAHLQYVGQSDRGAKNPETR